MAADSRKKSFNDLRFKFSTSVPYIMIVGEITCQFTGKTKNTSIQGMKQITFFPDGIHQMLI